MVDSKKEQYAKIGFSNDCHERLKQLQTAAPFELKLIFKIDGNIYQEIKIHSLLKEVFKILHLPDPINEWYPYKHPWMQIFFSNLRMSANAAIDLAEKKIINLKENKTIDLDKIRKEIRRHDRRQERIKIRKNKELTRFKYFMKSKIL